MRRRDRVKPHHPHPHHPEKRRRKRRHRRSVRRRFLPLRAISTWRRLFTTPVFIGARDKPLGTRQDRVELGNALRPVLQSLGAKHILPGIYATDSQVTLSPEGSYSVHSDVAVRLDDAVNLIITETLRPTPPVAGRFEPVAFSQVRCSV